MEMRRLLTSGPGADGQGGTDVVRIANRIGHGQEADVLDIVSRKEAKVRGVRSIWNSVKDIGHKDIIDIHTDLGKRSAHHAELSVKIIVRGRRDAGEGLKRTERIIGQDGSGLAEFAAGQGEVAHGGPVLWFKNITTHLDAFGATEVFGRETDGELLCFLG